MLQKLKKIDKALKLYQNNLDLIQCPICQSEFKLVDKSLVCNNNHTFNFNKKGFVTFSNKINNDVYDQTLFAAREYVFAQQLYLNVAKNIKEIILDYFNHYPKLNILDAGSGEGYYLNYLANNLNDTNTLIGLDLSSQAIVKASNYDSKLLLMIADLASIPIQANKLDVILNILSPANYDEFKRTINNNGLIIKVIPNQDYLLEIRKELALAKHDNTKVYEVFKQNLNLVDEIDLKYTISIDHDLKTNLVMMTPLTQNLSDIQKSALINSDFNTITIDLKILIGKIK